MTAYQIISMMEGVVQRGTGDVVKAVGKPLAGKTGTTNDEKDAWFVGFSPDLVVGVFIGYDKPRSLGDGETGGVIAAPIFRDFMKMALADKPAMPFRVPPGIKLVRDRPTNGLRACARRSGQPSSRRSSPGTDAARRHQLRRRSPAWIRGRSRRKPTIRRRPARRRRLLLPAAPRRAMFIDLA